MPIRHWPRTDRPREKLIIRGESALTDAELIAIFLRTGVRGKSAVDVAQLLLDDFGGLKNLLEAPLLTLLAKPGIGRAKFVALKAALELGRRCLIIQPEHGESFSSSQQTRRFIAQQLSQHTREVFACLFMDINNRLIGFEELFFGSIHEAAIYPREIVKRGLLCNAARIIIAHNHPSGVANPSDADITITHSIQTALALIDIQLLDHILVGHQTTYSFAENGLI